MTVFLRPSLLFLLVRVHLAQALTFLVTGANGYIGRAVVHELLLKPSSNSENGVHEIICLVRPHRVTSEQNYWEQYSGTNQSVSSPRIRVLPYDMLDGGKTLQQAFESCNGERCVFHLASVFGPTDDHKQTALDNVQGTEDLVKVIAQEGGRCKLVLTSSMAAVRGTGQAPSNGMYYTHKDWNTVSQLGANWGASYQWSKMHSEHRATELCNEYDIPLVVLNPSFVFGPASKGDSTSSYSLSLVGQWARGESPVQSRLYVDVRDVAQAQVAAALRPDTAGKRFIVSTEARVPSQEISEWLKEVCAHSGLSDPDKIHFDANFDGGAIPIGEREVEATDRLRQELGVTLRPVKETIMDMARVLLEEKANI